MRLSVALLLMCGLIAGVVNAQDDTSIKTITIEYDGESYTVEVFEPSTYDPEMPTPLVIAFHPASGSAEAMARLTAFNERAEESGVLVAYPDSGVGYWDYGAGLPEWESVNNVIDHPAIVRMAYEALQDAYNIGDVYLVGFSNGSRMALRMACEYPDWFSGVAVVAAGITSEVATMCETASMPFMYQHGTEDTVVPWEGKPLTDNGTTISYAYAATDTVTFWALQNECTLEPEITDLDDLNVENAVRVRLVQFNDCETDNPVYFYAVLGGGHSWLGAVTQLVPSDFTPDGYTSDFVWSFFGLN